MLKSRLVAEARAPQNVLWGGEIGHVTLPSGQENLDAFFQRKSGNAMRIVHLAAAIWCFAAATMISGVKPNFFCNSLSGAEAPNVSMPTL